MKLEIELCKDRLEGLEEIKRMLQTFYTGVSTLPDDSLAIAYAVMMAKRHLKSQIGIQ